LRERFAILYVKIVEIFWNCVKKEEKPVEKPVEMVVYSDYL